MKDAKVQIRPQKRLYSVQDASVYLGRSVCAIREMIWAGKLPYVKDGRRTFLDIQDMNEWIDCNKTKGNL
jgi:excisionase family DNA binding protein